MRVRCGGPELTEYAVGRLPLSRSAAWDRHLVVCQHCVAAVADERALQARLFGAPAIPGDLRAQLLALALPGAPGTDARTDGAFPAPPPPSAPPSARPAALPLMALTDPPAHRSVRHAVAAASVVAGLGVGALCSLSVAGGLGTSGGGAGRAPVTAVVTVPPSSGTSSSTARAADATGSAGSGSVTAVAWMSIPLAGHDLSPRRQTPPGDPHTATHKAEFTP